MTGQGRPRDIDVGQGACEGGTIDRRRFLTQLGVSATGILILTGCNSGCSSNTPATRPRDTTSTGPSTPEVEPLPLLVRPAIPTQEPIIRVRIATAGSGEKLEIAHPSGRIEVREGQSLRAPHGVQSPLTIVRRGGRWDVIDRAGQRLTLDAARPVDVLPSSGSAGHLQFTGASYPGMLRCAAVTTSDRRIELDLVNYLPLEQYLPGVLSKELYPNWHGRTFEAQAIAARSFACAEAFQHAERRHYDVTSTQQSQVYGGASDLAVAHAAAIATRGKILAWEQTVVPAYYSSCCGGVANSAIDGIGPSPINDIPPLAARSGPNACSAAPVYRWQNERLVQDVLARFRAWAAAEPNQALANLSEISSIEPAKRNDFGRPVSIVISGAAGERIEIPARRFREAVDFTTPSLPAPAKPMRSSFITASFSGGTAIFSGRGYGHGAGLCQYCAQALAQRGVGNAEMLSMFYPGAEIVQAYG